jgi:5'-nucleotidase/UDP-sugar diphosphatase
MYLPALKKQNVNLIIALTHLPFADDRALARRFPDIDLIIGGHEHYPITAAENRTLISKAGSDAKFVARIDVNPASSVRAPARQRGVERFYELIPVTSALADEPRTAAVVASYESRLGTELEKVVGNSRTPLDADTVRVRGAETNLGDLFADAARSDADADLAIINAGSIRGDRVYPPGPLTRRMLAEMHPLGDFVCKIAVTGRIVLEALNHGVSRLPATAGQFPQVSGLTMTVNELTESNRVRDVKIDDKPLDPNKIYTVATTDYQLKGGDGYEMFAGQRVLVSPETGDLLLTALEKYVTDKGVIAPVVEGRITIVR